MHVRIEGHDLPGRRSTSDGELLDAVHVAIQRGRDPEGLVPGDAAAAAWAFDVVVRATEDGMDLGGPHVQGRRGDRFWYLTWGQVAADGTFAMFRRAKLHLADVDPELLARAAGDDTVALVGRLGLTDERGGPRCARVRPPLVAWSVEPT